MKQKVIDKEALNQSKSKKSKQNIKTVTSGRSLQQELLSNKKNKKNDMGLNSSNCSSGAQLIKPNPNKPQNMKEGKETEAKSEKASSITRIRRILKRPKKNRKIIRSKIRSKSKINSLRIVSQFVRKPVEHQNFRKNVKTESKSSQKNKKQFQMHTTTPDLVREDLSLAKKNTKRSKSQNDIYLGKPEKSVSLQKFVSRNYDSQNVQKKSQNIERSNKNLKKKNESKTHLNQHLKVKAHKHAQNEKIHLLKDVLNLINKIVNQNEAFVAYHMEVLSLLRKINRNGKDHVKNEKEVKELINKFCIESKSQQKNNFFYKSLKKIRQEKRNSKGICTKIKESGSDSSIEKFKKQNRLNQRVIDHLDSFSESIDQLL